MKRQLDEAGFTLIEMMIVLLIISVLILIAIPNVAKHSQTIDDKGCQAYVKMVQGQVEAYKVEHNKVPKIDDLKGDYLLDGGDKCPNGKEIEINDGEVSMKKEEGTESD